MQWLMVVLRLWRALGDSQWCMNTLPVLRTLAWIWSLKCVQEVLYDPAP